MLLYLRLPGRPDKPSEPPAASKLPIERSLGAQEQTKRQLLLCEQQAQRRHQLRSTHHLARRLFQ